MSALFIQGTYIYISLSAIFLYGGSQMIYSICSQDTYNNDEIVFTTRKYGFYYHYLTTDGTCSKSQLKILLKYTG